jgi:hypothetical protein
MKTHMFSLAVLAFALPLAGCSSPSLPVEQAREPSGPRLGDAIDVSLAELLTKPRAQLAEMADELAKRVQIQEKARQEGRLRFTLLPSLRLPLAVPVLREAHFSAKAGFSLPPYVNEERKDSALALHLARYGDIAAANALVEPNDAETKQLIDKARYEREYPVEWTRLVGLFLHSAQLVLATGDLQGGTELVLLHRQLRTVLDPRAAKGILGAVLLSRGRQTLTRAAAVWKADKKEELSAQAAAALADWGDVPALTTSLQPGLPRAQMTRVLRSSGQGRALPALCTARAFDLLALPFPDDGAETVIASFDDGDCCTDVLITYRSGFSGLFPEPALLALLLEDGGVAGDDGPNAVGLRNRTYRLGDLNCVVSVVGHGGGVGAFVRLSNVKQTRTTIDLPRDLDTANLDRTFEQNRVRLGPEQPPVSAALTIRAKGALSQLRNPLPSLQLEQAELRRETGHDLAASLELRYAVDNGDPPALHKLALPFWAAFGLSQMQGISDKNGGHLALIWEDSRSRYTLRFPFDTVQSLEMEVSDRQGPGQLAERERAAVALDRLERERRLKAGKPLTRLARHVEEIELGLSKSQVLQRLPPGQAVLKRDMPDGLVVTFNGATARTDSSILRQLFVRFDNAGRVAEVRARYVTGHDAREAAKWTSHLLNRIVKRAGAPGEEPSPWTKVWADLPPQKPGPHLYRWQDDTTLLIFQRDAGGVELALRDRTADSETRPSLLPLEYLPRGPTNAQLGNRREALLEQWKIKDPATTEDGALILRPPPGGPFDVIFVWFDNDHAARIVARHNLAKPIQAARGLADAWGRELSTLGWYRRQDMVASDILQGLGWHDDRTRVRIFWQEPETSGPPRIFTEWKNITLFEAATAMQSR